MPTMIQTTTRADNVNQAGLIIDMEAQSKWLDEDTYLFETLTRKLNQGTVKATRMDHRFRERRLEEATVIVTATASAADTTISVDHPEYFHRDQVVACPATGEIFIMNEDTGGGSSAGKITVLNIAGSGGITNEIASGSRLINLGEAHAEGETIPLAWNVKEEEVTTYLYQFDRVNKITDIGNAEETYGESELAKSRRQFWIETKRALNLMLYLGQNNRETTSASGPRRHVMRGLIEWLESVCIDASGIPGGLTMTTLGQTIRPTKAHSGSSTTKLGICGQNSWISISAFPNGAVMINPGKDQNWGITLKELNTPFGDIMIGYDPTLSDEYGLAGELFILDPKKIAQLEMTGLPLRMRLNVGNNTDIHNITDVISGTRGLKTELEELHRRVHSIG